MAAALEAVAANGPSGVSGRAVARAAGVHHAQIQQMFGSVDGLVTAALIAERDRFVAEVITSVDGLPDPFTITGFPLFWRAITQVVLDPGHVDMAMLTEHGPIARLADRLGSSTLASDGRDYQSARATAWVLAPLGVLVFQQPLRESLGISDEDWPACLSRVDHRLRSLPLSPLPVPLVESHLHDRQPIPTPVKAREKLLQAAEDLLAFRLESNVRGRELADHAGVNYGLVNHYFGSKNAVFDEVLERIHERFRDDVVEVFAEADMLRLGLDEVFSRHLPFLRVWASRLLGERPVPGFNLLGGRRIRDSLLEARGVRPGDGQRVLDAVGDTLAAVGLQTGWVLFRPLLTAPGTPGTGSITGHDRSIYLWLLADDG
jgi:AcrR family transcriptional regulator